MNPVRAARLQPSLASLPADSALDQLERCWLRAMNQADALQSECRLLEQVLLAAQADWRDARARLVQAEALRDALGAECTALIESGDTTLCADAPGTPPRYLEGLALPPA